MAAATPARLWTRETEPSQVHGHPCLVYRDRPRSIAALLHDAQRWKGREFVVEGSRRLTSDAFAAAVGRVVARLRQLGIARGDRVVLLAYNSIDWLAAFWAVQSLGAVAVLCNAWWSAEEAADALAQVQPRLVLADQLARRGLEGRTGTLAMATVRDWVDANDAVPLPALPAVEEDDLAIIMFTSGTTGRPKGALMSQRGVVANLQNLLVLTGRLPDELAAEAPGTVSLLTVPLFHLAGIQVSISTLLTGGRLVLLEGRFDAGEVLRLIEQEKVRVWGSIPTMVSRAVEHPDLAKRDVSSLRSIPMGGAAIPPELRVKVQQA